MTSHSDANAKTLWWQRSRQRIEDGKLHFGSMDLSQWICDKQTPLYLYDWVRVQEKIDHLRQALASLEQSSIVYYAMKSNRFAPLLTSMAHTDKVGIDACSLREIQTAKQCGFSGKQISFTATGVSRNEWAEILADPDIWINADSLRDISVMGALDPNRTIGIRLNLDIGIGYRQNAKLEYAGGDALSKFGVPYEQLGEAIDLAASLGLTVGGIHCHSGCGYLDAQMDRFREIVDRLSQCLSKYPAIERLNIGGGLGIPLVVEDQPLDLDKWVKVLCNALNGFSGILCVEPGDFLVKDSGILLVEVTQVLIRRGRRFVTVNAGFNIHPEPLFYDLPLYPVPLFQRSGEWEPCTLAGNINEAHDLWYESIDLPPLEEGDKLAFLNAGGYGASMSSDHCQRGEFLEYLQLK